MSYLLVTFVLGALAVVAWQQLGVLAAVAVLALLWPIAWAASFRIARPLWEVARVAHHLREGRLHRREELKSGDDEVGEVADALGDMAGRLSRQLAQQRSLLAAVSHELRSPLGRLRVMVELSREGRAPEDLHDELQAEIDGMDALVGDLLAAARIDFEAVSPSRLSTRSVARRALEVAGLSEDLFAGEDVEIEADATLLVRALAGLLDNGHRHGGTVLSLRVSSSADRVRFSVADDGPGFAPGEEESAFEPFWRRPGQRVGTGLGLALVRQIAEWHGGTAGAENRGEGGASVWIELPGRVDVDR